VRCDEDIVFVSARDFISIVIVGIAIDDLLLYLIKRLLANFFSYQPTVLDGIRILLKKMI